MHIIIIGAGQAGQMLARRLQDENHTIALIDMDKDALAEASANIDIVTIQGEGSRPKILEQANVKNAEVLLAVSGSDEANLLACVFAGHAGVPTSVARVTHSDYEGVAAEAFGIDLIVNEHVELAKELATMVKMPAALEVAGLFDDRAIAIGVKMPTDSPLQLAPLRDAPPEAGLEKIRFIATENGGKVKIPDGETQFIVGDTFYVVGEHDDVDAFLEYACPSEKKASRIVIAGGGATGISLAHILQKGKSEVVVIENKLERAEMLSEILDCLVVHGDFLDSDVLDEVQLNENSDFIATTANDESNIMACILAERKGAAATIARITREQYHEIITKSSMLDRAMDPYVSLFNSIYHFIQGRNVKSDLKFQHLDAELLEFDIPVGHTWVAKKVMDLKLPKGSIIAMILRDGQGTIPATGSLILLDGDRVAIFTLMKSVKKVRALFA